MDQYKRGCGVKRLFLIQASVSVGEVSLDSAGAAVRYGSVFKKRSKTLRDYKRLVRLWRVEGWPPPPAAESTYAPTEKHTHTGALRCVFFEKLLVTVELLLGCGTGNFVDSITCARRSRSGARRGCDLCLPALCGFLKRCVQSSACCDVKGTMADRQSASQSVICDGVVVLRGRVCDLWSCTVPLWQSMAVAPDWAAAPRLRPHTPGLACRAH